ncbi:MAG: DUF4332 domain-containing protein [Hyphomicrobiaceae bacterium]
MKLEDRPIVKVDDGLLSLCNQAYAGAEARAASEVLVADLVRCLVRSAQAVREIEAFGAPADRLARGADALILSQAMRSRRDGPIPTSDGLKTLLLRAERRALEARKPAADVGDVVHVLFRQSDDIAGAEFARQGEGASHGARSRDTSIWDLPRGLGAAASAGGTDASARSSVDAGDRGFQGFLQTAAPAGIRTRGAVSTLAAGDRGTRSERGSRVDGSSTAAGTGAAQLDAISGRVASQERQQTDLRFKLDGLTDQLRALSGRLTQIGDQAHDAARGQAGIEARIEARFGERAGAEAALRAEVGGLSRRLEAQDRQIAELQHLVDALSQQVATAAARLSQALDLGQRQADLIAALDLRVESRDVRRSDRTGRRRDRDRRSARSRSRRRRQRSLRLRLRQRRRMRLRPRRRDGWRRSARGPARLWSSPPAAFATSAPLSSLQDAIASRLSATPQPFLQEMALPIATSAPPLDLEEEIAEPIEDEDDLEPEGAFGERPKRFYLALDDDIEKAPSIGPRTAARLAAVGLATVRDLLRCEPREIAPRVASRYVSADRVAAWKSQARLVCTIPWLRGTHAQLLVGAGFDTLESLQDADAASVCAGILRFAGTREGQSVLRSGPPPAPERIATWMGHVSLAEPERARLAA